MPGLAGIISITAQSEPVRILNIMLAEICEDWYQTDVMSDEKIGFAIGRTDLGIVNTEDQPYKAQNNNLSVFLYGDIYYSSESNQMRNCENNLLQTISTAYNKQGIDFINELNGEFLIVIIDRDKRCLYVCNDRYGRRPLYYSMNNGDLIFSSEIKSLIAVPGFSPIVDQEALAEFLTFGYILGNETLLSNVTLLPPAGILECSLDRHRIEISTYWDLKQNLSPIDKPDDQLLGHLCELFINAVERRLSKSKLTGISLSGGMDSRVIAAVVDPEKYAIKSVTSGLSGCIDEEVTARIASIAGLEHVFYEFDDQLFRLSESDNYELMREAIIRTDGMRGTSSSAMTAFSARKWRDHALDIVMTGHGGEIAKLDQAYEFSIRDHKHIATINNDFQEWAFKRMSQSSLPAIDKKRLFSGELAKIINDSPRGKLDGIVRRLDQNLPAEQKVSFLFVNEAYRKRALYALSIHKAYAEIRLPFYDDDFLDLIVRTPYKIRSKYRVHTHIISECKPELLGVMLSETRMRPNPVWIEKLVIGLPFKVMKKLGFYKRDFPEVYFQANSDPEFFKGILLDKSAADRGYFSPKIMSNLIDDYARGRSDIYHFLHLQVISELWHRNYIDSQSPPS